MMVDGLTDGCPQTSVMMARKVYRGPRPDETLRIHDCEGKNFFFFSSSFCTRRLNGGVDAGSLVPDGTEFHRVHR